MAKIKKLSNGNWIAVHSTNGKRLKGQPQKGFSRSGAISFAKKVVKKITGRTISKIEVWK